MSHDFDLAVDARGLNCPWPVLKLRRALESLQRGEVVRVIATEPQAATDFRTFCQRTGNALLHIDSGPAGVEVFVRKK